MKLITGIASTTHIDRHGEKMAKSALKGMKDQYHQKYIRFLIEHDFDKSVGVNLACKIVPMDDGEWALLIVAGIFENEEEIKKYKFGERNTEWEKYLPYLEKIPVPLKSSKMLNEPAHQSKNLADLLALHLDSTQVWPDGKVLKIKRFIASCGDLQIHVYKDHPPAHFHVLSKQRGIDARFNLKTLNLISHKHGQISKKDQIKIKNFFETHPAALALLFTEHDRMNES